MTTHTSHSDTPSNNTAQENTTVSALTLQQLLTTAQQVLPHHKNTLQHMLQDAEQAVSTEQGALLQLPVSQFVLDSRQLTTDAATKDIFVLLKSHTQPIEKSQQYAQAAAQQAACIISEIDPADLQLSEQDIGCPLLYVPNIRDVLGTLIQLSLLPSSTLSQIQSTQDLLQQLPQVIAVTGTNGKTTISQLIAQLCHLSALPELADSAVMGTAGNGRLGSLVQASHTTGDALAVQRFLRQMQQEGVDVLALEASSHGLDQQRLQGVPVKVAVYSNLSRDHLDYHPDMQDYARAKARLFDKAYFPQLTHAIINIDDDFAPMMAKTAIDSGVKVWLYSLNPEVSVNIDGVDALFVASSISPSLTGVEIELTVDSNSIATDSIKLHSPLLGRFNVANVLAAVAGAMALGVPLDAMPALVKQLQGASGRMQRAESANDDQGVFIVDYAHTPDALTQVLTSLKSHCEGKLWAVFGCGGDRDKGKRPLMAQAGLSVADQVVLTSDNPRSEDPVLILEDMQQGMTEAQHQKTTVIADRKQAINYVVQQAGAQDIVVIAGKGHETYQEIKGVRYDFDDRLILQEALIEAHQG
ncbi:UDP-N-acetylmuramoyl-L-alanyl-D-glutamate--2,6-diaminopimelate ligase [Psychrobacter sp. FDAARGOS_221]|uniref:UDP-N-acetylmuramoyl-L-alanyl-D-glutamate--2, 6-diaminopimelate ligase n=1 Tax=Psychrobacter sp. FDAARGOS_221 TaxID=1975705 RepID=UPI000BB53D3F|nr:UDP-N-acetylmuramoyl-L-alanyl-D-glutamate--2,6-diaminopimelate ligase [Psychrobacter sp. FDAARGOS_221]PNK60605.1 UDP-N-acetylmuramoyl-L-alanyl-D-glutamate--2,6-diaminopimelate ligase [Psychrobacter sp. FDAARGOS_221]